MAEHLVTVRLNKKKFEYNTHCVHVCPGDTITWRFRTEIPFALMVKDFISPLDWSSAVLPKGETTIVGKVLEDAEYGFYPYGVCAYDGGELLLDDPEIIVKPPKGGK
jgi:plastocyanin